MPVLLVCDLLSALITLIVIKTSMLLPGDGMLNGIHKKAHDISVIKLAD